MKQRGTEATLYNDNDPFVCEWLRNLIDAGELPEGDVLCGSIADIDPSSIPPTFHTFAGIGGWPLALRMAGWPDDRPVWTGSCPCQPFSSAGKRKGIKDDRHLWPAFRDLIEVGKPSVVFGEQVASAEVIGAQQEADFFAAVRSGDYSRANKLAKKLVQSPSFHYWRRWVDGVSADLAGINYSFGWGVLGAHSVGAPHIRQRLYWVAHTSDSAVWMQSREGVCPPVQVAGEARQRQRGWDDAATCCGNGGGLGNADDQGPQGHGRPVGECLPIGREGEERHGSPSSWDRYDLVLCREPTRDGGTIDKARRVEPGTFPLAHGVSNRVGRLRAYGNAIVPQVAAEFVRAFMEAAA